MAAARRQGENRLDAGRKNSVAALFFSQFRDLMILILAAATVVSALMGETAEAITIIAIVLLNAVMGFLQEYKTEKTLGALQSMTAPTARVVRSGVQCTIPAAQVVCGDVALLRAGDRVPADGRLLEARQLSADESLLTGESVAVEKRDGDAVYMGTMVASGGGVMQVSAVGMSTEMGRIASMMQHAEPEKTPLQQRLQQLGKVVAIGCLVICISVGLLGWLRGEPFLEMLLTGISLAVAAIPEGMPAIVTIVLALSVGRILKKGAIIRRLPAVETLGCAGVICSDKTGTITQNRMSVQAVYCAGEAWYAKGDLLAGNGDLASADGKAVRVRPHSPQERFWRCAALCADAQFYKENGRLTAQGPATEVALLAAAYSVGVTAQKLQTRYIRQDGEPFDSSKKRMSVTVSAPGGERLFLCKGAPDVLFGLCAKVATPAGDRALAGADRRALEDWLTAMAKQGCRVLALAENTDAAAGERGMTLLGLAALQDPPKPQVAAAVRRCRRAGMKPVMITGDHPDTARAIAAQVGIWRAGDTLLTGTQLETMTDEALSACCMRVSVYARVTPQHKLRIVQAYQSNGQVVAMTGDAVAC